MSHKEVPVETQRLLDLTAKPVKVVIRVSNLSDHYRKFRESSDDYEMNEENPFAEPAEIYTNVENGHGIFALSARSNAELEVK